jgi:transporter family-2 protein
MLAVLSGAVAPLQVGINAQLAKTMIHPLQATVVSFIVGTFGVTIVSFFFRVPLPPLMQSLQTPPMLLTGGLLGVFMVMSAITTAPRLGAAVFIAASIAGQMIASLLMDYYGVMGYAAQPISITKIVGVLFVMGGVFLIRGL